MQALSFPVHNVLCAEGYRWIWLNAGRLLLPSYMSPLLAVIISIGCLQFSGMKHVLRSKRRTVDERLGFTLSLIVFALLFTAFLVPVFRVESAMRSVTGHLFPSPWFECMPYTLSAIIFLTTYSYCLVTRKESFYHIAGMLLHSGISRYALWLVNFSLLNLVYEISDYAFDVTP